MPSTRARRLPGGSREAASGHGRAVPLRPRAATGTVRTAVQRGRLPRDTPPPRRGICAASGARSGVVRTGGAGTAGTDRGQAATAAPRLRDAMLSEMENRLDRRARTLTYHIGLRGRTLVQAGTCGIHRGQGAGRLPTKGRIYVCNRHLHSAQPHTVANAGRTIYVCNRHLHSAQPHTVANAGRTIYVVAFVGRAATRQRDGTSRPLRNALASGGDPVGAGLVPARAGTLSLPRKRTGQARPLRAHPIVAAGCNAPGSVAAVFGDVRQRHGGGSTGAAGHAARGQ